MSAKMIDLIDTILLLDDEPHCMDWLVEYLEKKKYKVIISRTLDDALDKLRNHRYAIVFCDLSIPVTDNLLCIIRKSNKCYEQFPGAYAALEARSKGHDRRQVIIYSVHESPEIDKIAKMLDIQYITKERPAYLKDEVNNILNYGKRPKNKRK